VCGYKCERAGLYIADCNVFGWSLQHRQTLKDMQVASTREEIEIGEGRRRGCGMAQ
jgi:hypothetical protein